MREAVSPHRRDKGERRRMAHRMPGPTQHTTQWKQDRHRYYADRAADRAARLNECRQRLDESADDDCAMAQHAAMFPGDGIVPDAAEKL